EIQAGSYDLVHRITPLSPTTNSPIAARCRKAGVPFMIGPLNGGVPWPSGFDAERRREREWLSYVRGAYKLVPGRGAMLSAASAILAGSRHTQSEVPSKYQKKCIYMPENAINPDRFNLTASQPGILPLRACFIGRLVPYKGPDMLLEAAAPLLRSGAMKLDVIGDGPLMDTLRTQAAALQIEQALVFHGWLEHAQVQQVAARCHLFTFPSIREFGGGVVLEAMALGVVPVIVDYAGPGELLQPGTGFKVPIGSRDEIVSRLHQKLADIAADPSVLPGMAHNAQAYAKAHFTWSAKAHQVAEVYDWVLGRRPVKPAPFPALPPASAIGEIA
ncbi:MAG: glycosyltransferase, partial [Pseudomonadota bacterium]